MRVYVFIMQVFSVLPVIVYLFNEYIQRSLRIKRKIVKREYRNYNKNEVQEIKENNITFYVVHLKDGKKYKQLSIFDGEVNVMEEFTLARN
jgi:hypothetical protein